MQEGVLRQRMIAREGYLWSSVYFSIIDEEWPTVRRRLEDKLAAYA